LKNIQNHEYLFLKLQLIFYFFLFNLLIKRARVDFRRRAPENDFWKKTAVERKNSIRRKNRENIPTLESKILKAEKSARRLIAKNLHFKAI
jgi:hypothetical protein